MKRDDLAELIAALSSRDPKTLSQKALKMTEEVGELAKRILPFEDAAGTSHRFIQKVDILEEVADSFLVGLSIMHHLGFTQDDLEEMMARKALKWDGIQKREADAKFPVPFEIHVTVCPKGDEKEPVSPSTIEMFKRACTEIGVKPILIDAQTNSGQSLFMDLQTSSVHVGTNRSAYDEMKRISDGLKQKSFEVVREKIETVPWHPAAPRDSSGKMPPNCYFESHIAVIIPEADRPKVQEIADTNKAHLSRNAFKVLEDGNIKLMITYRRSDANFLTFQDKAAYITDHLLFAGIAHEKPIVEFSIFDSKVSHDASWIQS